MPTPTFPSLEAARSAAMSCTRCLLSEHRERVVFGAGDPQASILLVGQGPSVTDDRTGLPFSGPAGELLDRALQQAGLSREEVWITNLHRCVAVRTPGRSEIRPPRAGELSACRDWLTEELAWVQPRVLVAIGGPAAKALLGKQFKLKEQRGQWIETIGQAPTLATWQPTYLKRLSEWDRPAAVQGWRDLVADLTAARQRAAA